MRYACCAVTAACALLLPFYLNPYLQYVVNLMLVNVIVTLGFNILIGYRGQLAFANTGFFGIGAYTAAILMGRYGVPFPVAIIGSAAVAGLVGFLLGLPALRLKRYSLALLTLAFVELLRWSYIHGSGITNGSSGLPVPAAFVFGIPISNDHEKFYVFLVVVGLCVWCSRNLLDSRVGRAIVALRDNELAGQSVGIWAEWYTVLAFTWSAVLVGVAGSLFAVLIGRVVPESFDLAQLLMHFAMVMVGGTASVLGSVLGAITLTALPELVRNFAGLQEIVFSLLLIGVLFFAPNGLAGLVANWNERRAQRSTTEKKASGP